MLVYSPSFRGRRPKQARHWSPSDREIRIFAHLSTIASEVRDVQLMVGRKLVEARLDYPSMDDLSVPVDVRSSAGLRAHQEVQLCYSWGGSSYDALTQVSKQVGPTRWNLKLPRDISRPDKRLFQRERCEQSWSIIAKNMGRLRTDMKLPVHDISAGGVGVYVSQELAADLQDRMLSGVLLGPVARPMPIRFRVANVRDLVDDEDGTRRAVAGGPFQGIGLRPHRVLAQAVSKLADARAA